MKDEKKTKGQLLEELAGLRQRLLEFEATGAERKGMEGQIRQQNEFLEHVLDSLPHPLYVVDVDDYTVKIANSAARLGSLVENPTCYALTHQRGKPCEEPEHPCPLEEVRETKTPAVVRLPAHRRGLPPILPGHPIPTGLIGMPRIRRFKM